MKNKVALITGATSGIGRETALLFASHGIKVAAAGRNEEAGRALVQKIREEGGEAIFIPANVADAKSVAAMIDRVLKHFGQLDFAFNNAGIEGSLVPLASLQEEDFDQVMNINLKGLWLCLKHEINAMMQAGGVIVNTSTNLTKMSEPNTGAYTASKSALEALTRIAAAEYGKFNIRINAVNPGATDTPMLRRIFNSEELEAIKRSSPLGKLGQPLDIAHAVLWLCSPQSGHITGTTLILDGGS